MKVIISIIFITFTSKNLFSQKNTLENINDATKNVIELFKGQKNANLSNNSVKIDTSSIVLVELCVYNKKDSFEIIYKLQNYKKETISELIIQPQGVECIYNLKPDIYFYECKYKKELFRKGQIKIEGAKKFIEIE